MSSSSSPITISIPLLQRPVFIRRILSFALIKFKKEQHRRFKDDDTPPKRIRLLVSFGSVCHEWKNTILYFSVGDCLSVALPKYRHHFQLAFHDICQAFNEVERMKIKIKKHEDAVADAKAKGKTYKEPWDTLTAHQKQFINAGSSMPRNMKPWKDQANRIHYRFDHSEFFLQLLRIVVKEWMYHFSNDPTKIVKLHACRGFRSVIFRSVEAANTSLLHFLLFECFEKSSDDVSSNNSTNPHVALNLENELDLDFASSDDQKNPSQKRFRFNENTVRWAAANLKSEECWKVLVSGFEIFGRQKAQKGKQKRQKNRVRSASKLAPWTRWTLEGKQERTVFDVSVLTFFSWNPSPVGLSQAQQSHQVAIVNPNKTSPLAYACLHGNNVAVKVLVEFAHCNPNNFMIAYNNDNSKPLEILQIPAFCCFHNCRRQENRKDFNNHFECLRILCRSGLDTDFISSSSNNSNEQISSADHLVVEDGLVAYFLDKNRVSGLTPMFDSALPNNTTNASSPTTFLRLSNQMESYMNTFDKRNPADVEIRMQQLIKVVLLFDEDDENDQMRGSNNTNYESQRQRLSHLETEKMCRNFVKIIHGKRARETVVLLIRAIKQHPQSQQLITQIQQEQIAVYPLDIYSAEVTRLLFDEKFLTPELCTSISNKAKKNLLISLLSGPARSLMHSVCSQFQYIKDARPEKEELEKLKAFIELGHCSVEEAFDGFDASDADRQDRSKTGNTLLHFIAIRNACLDSCRTMKYLLQQISCPEKRQRYLNHRNFLDLTALECAWIQLSQFKAATSDLSIRNFLQQMKDEHVASYHNFVKKTVVPHRSLHPFGGQMYVQEERDQRTSLFSEVYDMSNNAYTPNYSSLHFLMYYCKADTSSSLSKELEKYAAAGTGRDSAAAFSGLVN